MAENAVISRNFLVFHANVTLNLLDLCTVLDWEDIH